MAFKEILAMWRSPKGSLSFKMTDEIKQKVMEVPNGTYVNIFEVREKKSEKAPDAKLTYKEVEQDDDAYDRWADSAPF
jgi:hypothetical protein